MRNSTDWNNYWQYEATYTDMDACYMNGYYHLKFSDYPALTGVIDDLAVMSILFYKNVTAGDVAYISDMQAYKVKESVNYDNLSKAINDLKKHNADGAYDDDNATQEQANTAIYARPYYVYEDAEGQRVTVYEDIVVDNYNDTL
ncbi:MAG: hypothetical protein IKV43_05125 [Clostridia bacterium]|nr:hypothetical protein [Clostridia bacterium]